MKRLGTLAEFFARSPLRDSGLKVRRMDLYHYKGCGLPNVYLQNGFQRTRTAYGEAMSIRNVEGLHEVIADHLVLKPGPLISDEFRYLRVFLELPHRRLGELFAAGRRAGRRERPPGAI